MVSWSKFLNFKDINFWRKCAKRWLDLRGKPNQVARYPNWLPTVIELETFGGDVIRQFQHIATHEFNHAFELEGSYREWSQGVINSGSITTEHGTAYLLGGDLDSFLSIYFPSVHFHLKEFDPEKHSLIVEPDYNLMV